MERTEISEMTAERRSLFPLQAFQNTLEVSGVRVFDRQVLEKVLGVFLVQAVPSSATPEYHRVVFRLGRHGRDRRVDVLGFNDLLCWGTPG